jgi:hypothetical protein
MGEEDSQERREKREERREKREEINQKREKTYRMPLPPRNIRYIQE